LPRFRDGGVWTPECMLQMFLMIFLRSQIAHVFPVRAKVNQRTSSLTFTAHERRAITAATRSSMHKSLLPTQVWREKWTASYSSTIIRIKRKRSVRHNARARRRRRHATAAASIAYDAANLTHRVTGPNIVGTSYSCKLSHGTATKVQFESQPRLDNNL
jgi:hypothetical protein